MPHLVAAHVDGGGVGVGVENLVQRGQDEGQRLGEICLERGRYLHDVPKHLGIFGPPCIHFGLMDVMKHPALVMVVTLCRHRGPGVCEAQAVGILGQLPQTFPG